MVAEPVKDRTRRAVLRAVVRPLCYQMSRAYYKTVYRFPLDAYRTGIDPLALLQVKPSCIRRYTGRVGRDGRRQVREDLGSVQDGDWDQHSTRTLAPHLPKQLSDAIFGMDIEESVLYRSLHSRFNYRTPWEQTEFYHVLASVIVEGFRWHGCESISRLRRRLQQLDALFCSIKEEGYKTQRQLCRYGSILTEVSNEIVVDIGRSGAFRLVCGRHRFCIARILDLDHIPVAVAVRHREWVESMTSSPSAVTHAHN